MTSKSDFVDDVSSLVESANGHFDIYILDRAAVAYMLNALSDKTAARLVECVFQILGRIRKVKRGHGPLCLDCDTEFHAKSIPPAAFMLLVPFANPTGSLVTAICENCLATKDLDEASVRVLRKLWPDAIATKPTQRIIQ
jgi:hypothetical protein